MKSDGVAEHCDSKEEEIKHSKKLGNSNIEAAIKPCNKKHFLVDSSLYCEISCLKSDIHYALEIYPNFLGRSKEAKKKRRKEVPKSPEKKEQNHEDDIHVISSGEDDCSNGMKSMNCFFFSSENYIFLKLQISCTNSMMGIYFCNVHIVS
jgi:hypothetical protein